MTDKKPNTLKAFYSYGMFHVRDICNPNGSPYWTPKDEEDLFKYMDREGYSIAAISKKAYYFTLKK